MKKVLLLCLLISTISFAQDREKRFAAYYPDYVPMTNKSHWFNNASMRIGLKF